MSIEPIFSSVLVDLIKVLREDTRLRKFLLVIPVALSIAATFYSLGVSGFINPKISDFGTAISIAFGIVFAIAISAYKTSTEQSESKARLVVREAEVIKNPEKIKAAWDLAQTKLESYIDGNISQVRSIYRLCVIVMFVGFGFVCYGALTITNDSAKIEAGTLSCISGILLSFLGGSFMVIYKSTMMQAKDYVAMLERINAVGMSLQIIDSLHSSNEQLKDESKAELARELLKIYSQK